MTSHLTGSGRPSMLRASAWVTASCICLGAAAPTSAQNSNTVPLENIQTVQFVADVGGSQRIDYSGKLRMLSQRIVAAACYHQAGIDSDASKATLEAAAAEFVLITDALEFGNPDLGVIGAEERLKTLVGLSKLRDLWAPIGALAETVAAGNGTTEDIVAMADQSALLLDLAERMVAEISGQYSNPAAILQRDAIVIDIAGRQRMLAQRMSKNVCLISEGINVEKAVPELAAAHGVFEASLQALHGGMQQTGIQPPPTPEIAAGLDVVLQNWSELQNSLDLALAGEALDDEQLSIVFNGSNQMTGNMNKVVGQYSVASKLGT